MACSLADDTRRHNTLTPGYRGGRFYLRASRSLRDPAELLQQRRMGMAPAPPAAPAPAGACGRLQG